jgi:hypothetical protein
LKNVRKTIDFLFKFYSNIEQSEEVCSNFFFFYSNISLLKNRLSRCESMLNRSNKSERIIQMNHQLCLQLQNEIDILQEKLSKLNEEFKIRKNTFSTVSFFNDQIFKLILNK